MEAYMSKQSIKKEGLSVLIKKLDTVFSEFIRLRDCDDNGTVTCFVTGERVWWRDADAAHFIDRGIMTTRYDEINVHATTVDTNRFEDPYKHKEKYRRALISKYGMDEVHGLEKKSISLQKYVRSDLTWLIDHYSEKVKQLKKQKGL